MSFEIEDGIPMPEQNRCQQFSLPSVLKRMEVSQSVLVPGKTNVTQVSYAIQKAKMNCEKSFYAKALDGGVRIWRTA